MTGVYGGTQKITISLPAALLQRLNEIVPARKRSSFIADALEKQLEIEEFQQALDESFGSWKEQDHADMLTGADIDAYIRESRQSWTLPDLGENEPLSD